MLKEKIEQLIEIYQMRQEIYEQEKEYAQQVENYERENCLYEAIVEMKFFIRDLKNLLLEV